MFKEPSFPTAEQRVTKEEAAKLSIELSESHEVFPFPGIEDASYKSLKAVDEEYPGIATPIDSLIERFTAHGMRFFWENAIQTAMKYGSCLGIMLLLRKTMFLRDILG